MMTMRMFVAVAWNKKSDWDEWKGDDGDGEKSNSMFVIRFSSLLSVNVNNVFAFTAASSSILVLPDSFRVD